MASLQRRFMLVVVLASVALPSFAATPAEFYLGMLQKGVAAYEAGRFDGATGPLRISAFGFVDSVEHYEMAHVYLALSYDRLGDAQQATASARRVVTAERIEPRYAVLSIPAATRTSFDALSRKLLAPAELTAFQRSPEAPAPQRAQAQPVPARPTPAQTTTPAPSQPAPLSQQTAVQTSPAKPRTEPVKTEPVKPQPAPVQVPKPQTPAPRPAESKPAQAKVAAETPAATKPAPATMSPAPSTAAAPKTSRPVPSAVAGTATVAARLTAAEQALATARLNEARSIYRELLDVPSLDRAQLLQLAEGLYRARDFGPTLRAFNRLGTLRRGEEPYRYYIAVALYETGQYARARQELTAALPYIEVTPDVARYKTKIEGAVN